MKTVELRRWDISVAQTLVAAQPNYSNLFISSWIPTRYVYLRKWACYFLCQPAATLVQEFVPCSLSVSVGTSNSSVNQPPSSRDYVLSAQASVPEIFTCGWDSDSGTPKSLNLLLNVGQTFTIQVDAYRNFAINDNVLASITLWYGIYNSPDIDL